MRRKRPYTEPDRIKERIQAIATHKHEGCRHDTNEDTMTCKKCGVELIRFERNHLIGYSEFSKRHIS